MNSFLFAYDGTNRDLKRIIVALLRSWIATNIIKINYWHKYVLSDVSVKKSETKLILIQSEDEEKLIKFLSKNYPQIYRMYIS